MNVRGMAKRAGVDWNDIVERLRTCLSEDQILRAAQLPAGINGRMTRSLGCVRVNRATGIPQRLELSRLLLERGEDQEVREVFTHEVAHVAADLWASDAGAREATHGPIWCSFARVLGVSTAATKKTSYLAEHRASKLKTVAVCDRCGFELKRSRRLNSRRIYSHRQCGGEFVSR